MIRKRRLRALTAGAVSLALLLMPAASLAATPSWAIVEAQSLPPVVQVDNIAGFSATVKNSGPSNISQLSVTAFFEQPFTTAGADTLVNPPPDYEQVPEYAAVFKNGNEIVGGCPMPWGAPVVCSIGSLGAGDEATIVVAYQTAGMQPAGIHGWWQSTGSGSTFCTDDDASHGDCLPIHVGPTQISNSADYGGGFFVTTGAVVTNAPIGGSNQVSTAINAPGTAKNLLVTVADEGSLTADPDCPAGFTCVLKTSEIHLGDGTAQYGLSKVVIEFHKTVLTGVNFKKLTVIHVHDDGFFHFIPGERSCDGTAECAMFENLRGGHGRVTLYLAQNGWVKYH